MGKQRETKLTDHMEGFKVKKINYSDYEVSFRRWVISQIDSGEMGYEEVRDRFHLSQKKYREIIRKWQSRYSDTLHVSLSLMSSEERAKHEKLEKRITALEKKLDEAKMKNIALETLIDVAETEFKVPIRKKPGSKQ